MHPACPPHGADFRAAVDVITEGRDSTCCCVRELRPRAASASCVRELRPRAASASCVRELRASSYWKSRTEGCSPSPVNPGFDAQLLCASGHLVHPAVAVVFAVLLMLT